MPPTTVPTNAASTSGTPMSNFSTPFCTTKSSETTAARRPEIAKAAAITRLARTPRKRAIMKSSDAARIWRPIAVRLRKATSSSSSAAVAAIITICRRGRRMSPSRKGSVSTGQRSHTLGPALIDEQHKVLEKEAEREGGDQQHRRVGIAEWAEGQPFASDGEDDDDENDRRHHRRRMPGADEELRRHRGGRHDERVGADHDQVAMGEVDQAHDAEDQPDARGR